MDVPMEHLQRVPRPSPPASGQDRSPLRLMDRISRAKNRMRQSRSSGTVGGEGGNLLAYPARFVALFNGDAQAAIRVVNAEEANPNACAIMSVAYMRGMQVGMARHGENAFEIVHILVV